MEEEIKLTDIEKDALKETANIGAGNASTELSKIVKNKVNIVVSDLSFISLKNLQDIIGGPKKMVVGVYTPVSGDMGGTVIVIFPIESALVLSSVLQHKTATTKALNKEDQEALRKMGNILSDSYLDALTQFLSLQMNREDPRIVSTFGESIIDIIMLSIDASSSHGLLIKTDFDIEKSNVNGKFILLLTTNKIDKILKKIKEKIG